MAMEDIHAIIYPNGEISQSSEGVMFSCEEPVWVMIPTQMCLLDLTNVILMNLGEFRRKEVTRIFYRILVAMANTFIYRKMPLRTDQNVSMMFSYHRGIASVFAIELFVQLASSPSPSFSPYVNRVVQHPPPEVSHFEDHARAFTIHSLEMDNAQAGGINSDNGDDDEFIPKTQPPIAEPELGLPTIAAPLRHVSEEADHYSTVNSKGMHSGSAEEGPSSYLVSGELELEIGLKLSNREITMLAIKNYNIWRSAEF
ncbi:hypothetical protein PIB30_066692 [Stylosanthes scabra]|uniref:Uncharacterized protein n=1 Tax=Stylosanthes scabra TaxID=79078 RepID=A0ABU6TN40_9FABA|nr:hypothetical protein [Stylosanthes scabra]